MLAVEVGLNRSAGAVLSHAGAEFFARRLRTIDPTSPVDGSRILVAGCGAGHEAALIQQLLGAVVTAVDVEDQRADQFRCWPDLQYQTVSVCSLPFSDDCFDAVFYHHVIEHVDQPQQSLRELSRVLKPGGWLFVGTPNRHRLFSSVGAHQQTGWEPTWKNKLRDNVHDWMARLSGRFHNRFGAHAGFSRKELTGMLQSDFDNLQWVTQDYLRFKYGRRRLAPLVALAAQPFVREVLPPSIYVFAQKPSSVPLLNSHVNGS